MSRVYAGTLFAFQLLIVGQSSFAATTLISLVVDARDVTRGIQHAHLTIPVNSRRVTLAYPKWIPGEHAADGPITQVVNLKVVGGGTVLSWRRDSLDPFSFHIEIPRGVRALDVEFDYLSPPKSFADGFGRTPNVTPHLVILPLNHFIMYPSDASAESILVKASVRIPNHWKFDSALEPELVDGDTLSLPVTSLYRLVDSPILVGEYFRTVELTSGAQPTRVSIAADAPADLAIDTATVLNMRRLVAEATGLFGAGHFRKYVWLVALGNTLELNGLEHHESTDIRDAETLFIDPDHWLVSRVVPHEFVHSWNGKYRRPEGLATSNYQEPMVDELLWAYEGLTRYLGDFVLRTRSGMTSPEQARSYLASVAALMDNARPGRSWRSVGDTATAEPAYTSAPPEWGTIRRKRDYYDEMLLVWLEADTLIREGTGGKRSLDDFCRHFFGGADNEPVVRPYSRKDLTAALGSVLAINWDAFFTSRVDEIASRAPLSGLSRGGWNLIYDDTPNEYLAVREKVDAADNLALSLGFLVKSDGTVIDVVAESPAFEAGLAPTTRILAINGRKWNIESARTAIVSAETNAEPINLIVESADLVRTISMNYHAGLRNPHLVRDPDTRDWMSQILAPTSFEAP
jgi:predicted metalloprotease with PDZ domain